MSETQQGPEPKYVAWRVVPYKRGTEWGPVYTDKAMAIRAAKEVDGENNWMIEGLTQERYERLTGEGVSIER